MRITLAILTGIALLTGPPSSSAHLDDVRPVSAVTANPAPPPPVPRPPAVPAAPIRVGGNIQQANLGPGRLWSSGRYLSREQVVATSEAVRRNPADICARGELIAFAYELPVAERIEHLEWMIQHHPQWEGFLDLDMYRGADSAGYERLKEAWLAQTESPAAPGTVLLRAARFMADRDPVVSVSLLERAVTAEPNDPRYASALGEALGRLFLKHVPDLAMDSERVNDIRLLESLNRLPAGILAAFREYTWARLAASDDRLLLRSALAKVARFGDMPVDMDLSLHMRLSALTIADFAAGRGLVSSVPPFPETECLEELRQRRRQQ